MFNKLSTKTLISLFVVLLIIVVIFIYEDNKNGEKSFRTNLVDIDTSSVTSIQIYPPATQHKEVKLFKEAKGWKVQLADNKTAEIPHNKVESLFRELLSIKASSLASTEKSQWKEFKVDSSGTEVKVFDGDNNVSDLVIGKIQFERPRNMTTYVRVKGDNNVYSVDGFLTYAFNHNENYFRDNGIIKDYYSNWKKLTFTYPGDSSFVLLKKGKKWEINNVSTDSAATAAYLSSISNLSSENMVDNFSKSVLNHALYHLTIQSTSKGIIEVTAYPDSSIILLNSSQNPNTYFNATENGTYRKLFVGKKHFFPKKEKKSVKRRHHK